ncbi:YhgE/Pip family protein, partial [Levilactobacillus suantsaii]
LAAATFMTIVAWLNLVLGKAGAFFSMVLLVLQLGASAGTYPLPLTSHFFQAIHPFLPMSYGVAGLRQTLMIGDSAWPDIGMLILFLMVFTGLTWLFYARRYARLKRIDFNDAAAVSATRSRLAAHLIRQKE